MGSMKGMIAIVLAAALVACAPGGKDMRRESAAMAESLVAQASQDVGNQRFDEAMEKALEALELAGEDARMKVHALAAIVGVDIMASRDADAWEKALEAEALAREHGLKEELAGILISKAKLCSYAEISPETTPEIVPRTPSAAQMRASSVSSTSPDTVAAALNTSAPR